MTCKHPAIKRVVTSEDVYIDVGEDSQMEGWYYVTSLTPISGTTVDVKKTCLFCGADMSDKE